MPSEPQHRKILLASLISTVFLTTACGGGGSAESTSDPALAADASQSSGLSTRRTLALALAIAPAPSSGLLLGSNSIQPSTDSNPEGVAEAFVFMAGSTGTASAVNVYLDAGNTATRVVAGIYADAGGAPGQLLANAALDNPTSGGWNSIGISPLWQRNSIKS